MNALFNVFRSLVKSQLDKGITLLDIRNRDGESFPTVKFAILRSDRTDEEIDNMMRQEKITYMMTSKSQGYPLSDVRFLYKIVNTESEYLSAQTTMVTETLQMLREQGINL